MSQIAEERYEGLYQTKELIKDILPSLGIKKLGVAEREKIEEIIDSYFAMQYEIAEDKTRKEI